jgi:CheY-like chemotaxis protein
MNTGNNSSHNSSRVVLLVEDGDDDIFFLKRAFEDAKISNPIEVAADCSEAMQYLSGQGKFADRKQFPVPALILLDLKLPDKNGLELLLWMQRLKTRSIPVIVFTSSSNIADVKAAYEAGAASYVVKPLTSDDRRQFALLVKDYWLGYNLFPS